MPPIVFRLRRRACRAPLAFDITRGSFRWPGLGASAGAALVALAVAPAPAQQAPSAVPADTPNGADTLTLPTIVITPTRTPLERAATGSSVEVIDRAELEAHPEPTFAEALEGVPGVAIATRGVPGSSSEVSIRGFAQEDVILRIDGIELADPGELRVQADFGQVLTGDIGRIEILKGAQSALYGGEAVGGVVEATTGLARGDGLVAEAFLEGGAFATVQGSARVGQGAEDWDASVAVSGFLTDGFSAASSGTEEDGYRNITVSATGSVDVAEGVTVGAAFRFLDRETDVDRVSRGQVLDALDATAASQIVAGRAFLKLDHFGGQATSELSFQGLASERSFVEAGDEDVFEGERFKVEYLGTLSLFDGLDLVAGGDWTREAVDTSDGLSADSTIAGGFVQAIWSPLQPLTLTGSVRGDRHSEFGGFITWRTTLAYRPIPGTVLRAAAGTGFRAPSNRELFSPDSPFFGPVGNPDLEPEETISWEAGIDQSLLDGRLRASATYFESRTDELIDFVFGLGYQQIPGTTRRRGAELGVEAQPLDWLTLGASYTFIDAEDPTGARLDFVPTHDVALSATARPIPRLTLAARASYLTGVEDGGVALAPFFLLDASVAWRVNERVELYARGENLLDQAYERVDGFETPGIAGYAGIRVNF